MIAVAVVFENAKDLARVGSFIPPEPDQLRPFFYSRYLVTNVI